MSQVRFKKTGTVGESSQFNTSTVGEVIVTTTEDYDTVFISDLDVWVNGQWKDMAQAFRDKDIIPDNYNQWFAAPHNDEERERGYI